MGTEVWSLETNEDKLNALGDTKSLLGAYIPSGTFHKDVEEFCKAADITPHPQLLLSRQERGRGDTEDVPGDEDGCPDEIQVRNWRMDAGNVSALCFGLKHCPAIRSIRMFNAQLTMDQLTQLVQVVTQTKVQELFVDWNGMQSTDADKENGSSPENHVGALFEQCLTSAPHLRLLSLRGNGIDSTGALAIARALRSGNCHLEALNLFQNDMDDVGAKAFAQSLPFSPNIRFLSLANNRVSDVGLHALVGGITRQEATPVILQEFQNAEPRIQAELDQAKKAKKKIDRATAMKNIGLPDMEVVEEQQYVSGNESLQHLVLSGNSCITPQAIHEASATLDAYRPKLDAHLCQIKLERLDIQKENESFSTFLTF